MAERVAVRQGFEPWVAISSYDGLANRCLKPLGHLTKALLRLLY